MVRPVVHFLASFCLLGTGGGLLSTEFLFAQERSSTSAPDPRGPGDPGLPTEDDPQFLAWLCELWAAQRQEIASAEIEYSWHISSYRNSPHTAEQVHAMLAQYDLVQDPEQVVALALRLKPYPSPTQAHLSPRTFRLLGELRRNDSPQGVDLFDGEYEMRYTKANDQLTVYRAGGSNVHRTALEDFRTLPPARLTPEHLQVVARQDDRVVLEELPQGDVPPSFRPVRYEVDPATGGVLRQQTFRDGALIAELVQSAWTTYPGGISLPGLRLRIGYEQGTLRFLEMYHLSESRLNEPVSADHFQMAVRKSAKVVDHRQPAETNVWRVPEDRADVRSLLVPVTVTEQTHKRWTGATFWKAVLLVNGLGLIVLSVVLWRRSDRFKVSSSTERSGERSSSESP